MVNTGSMKKCNGVWNDRQNLSKLKNFPYRLYAISSFMRVVRIQEIFQGGARDIFGKSTI